MTNYKDVNSHAQRHTSKHSSKHSSKYSANHGSKISARIRNQSGQGLIEYLILTALLAVATMGVVKLLGQSVSARYADVVNSIQGNRNAPKTPTERVEERHYKKRDMSDFMRGATNRRGSSDNED